MKRNKVYKKIILSILVLVMMISSVYLGESLAGKSAAIAQAAEDTSFLDVKVQHKVNADGSYAVRFVSSVDKLEGYSYVGFLLEYEGKTYSATTNTVYTRIGASADNLDYKYSPKVIDTASEYFITAVYNVPANKTDENLKVSAFYIASGETERTLGETRIININDSKADQISMYVDETLEVGLTYDVMVGEMEGTATALDEHNVRIVLTEGSDKTTLKSVSDVTLKATGTDEAVATSSYRNLLSTGTDDTTAFNNYSSENEFIIASQADMYGFSVISNQEGKTFTNKTVYMVADVAMNDVDKVDWSTGVAIDDSYTVLTMDSIGTTGTVNFNGIFDGQGHTISGVRVYNDTAVAYTGFFDTIYTNGVVKNFSLVDSYIEGASTNGNNRCGTGSIAGNNIGTIQNVYSDAIVTNSKQMTGGIAGWSYNENSSETIGYITNCWFDGEIHATNSIGGIIGGAYVSDATVKHCLNTGSITLQSAKGWYVGGIIGHLQNTGTDVLLEDCLNVGTFDKNSQAYAGLGTLAGRGNQASTLTVKNSYGIKEFASVLYGQEDSSIAMTNTGNTSAVRYLADLNGYGAYQWTKLDFEDVDGEDEDEAYWVLKDGTTPTLAVFDTTDLELATAKTKLDHTWYDLNNKENLVIDTKEKLLSFNEICDKTRNYFADHKVYLGADIDLNEGWTASATAPTDGITWTPISQFSGTFNGEYGGQMHTIRGLYVTTTSANTGLFGIINSGATVQNLKLRNSYITSTKGSMGSIAGKNHGTISTVYSDADIISTVTGNAAAIGGIAGGVNVSTGENTIENCWFDGSITVAGKACGGILGWSGGSVVSINHCLNTGTLTTSISSAQLGGLMGFIQESSTVTIEDSLNAGVSGANKSQTGAIVGGIQADSAANNRNNSLTVKNTYGLKDFGYDDKNSIGWNGQTDTDTGLNFIYGDTKTNVTASSPTNGAVAITECYGELLNLDYVTYWLAKENSTPVLKSFADLMVAETNWYDASKTSLTIIDAQQLLGFNELGADKDFSGQTISLTTDITLNEGNAGDWATVAPQYTWATIPNFSGVFDGQLHTISGIYISSENVYTGLFGTIYSNATVKNLRLVNAYIEGNGSETRSGVGSIAGRSNGIIQKVYSDAIITNNKQMTGGIVGMVVNISDDTGTDINPTISECWFDGTINMLASGCGGVLGCSYGKKATIQHCLNTGAMIGKSSGSISQVGGLCGYAQGASVVSLEDSMNAGTYEVLSGSISQKGPVVGAVANSATVTVANVYGNNAKGGFVDGASGNAYGWISSGTWSVTENTECVINQKSNFVGTGATNLDFGNYWTSRATSTPILTCFVGDYEVAEGWLFSTDVLPAYETQSATLSTALYSTGAYVSTYAAQSVITNVAGKATKMQSVEGTTADEIVVYADKLTSNGYTLESQTSIENNVFYRFKKDSNRVYVNYYGNTGRATIELDESGKPFAFESSVSYAKTDADTANTEYYLYALRMAETRTDDTTGYPTNGAAMIVKCADNSIIMIDGGAAEQMNTEEEQTRLYNFLKEITGQSEVDNAVINVSAWVITHFDTDHCAGFSEVLLANSGRYNVQRLVCNLPDEKVVLNANDEIIKTGLSSIVSKVKSALSPYTDCKEVKLRTGDVLTICGVDITTLFTHTDAANASVDGYFIPSSNSLFNATSTIAQFTSPEGMKMLVTGDMFDDTETILCSNFSATTLNTDILQQPHHNSTDVQEIYDRASAQIMFFTQRRTIVDIKWWKDYDEYQNAQKAKNACEAYYCGGSETVGFKWDSENNNATQCYYSELIY